jgi:hypothetical protein
VYCVLYAVANVIKMVIKCGETNNEALQLAVVRALLTFTTAEHFIAHGECLLAAVRAVFNLALGSENPINKRTACNALLQVSELLCRVLLGNSAWPVCLFRDALSAASSVPFCIHLQQCTLLTISMQLQLFCSASKLCLLPSASCVLCRCLTPSASASRRYSRASQAAVNAAAGQPWTHTRSSAVPAAPALPT